LLDKLRPRTEEFAQLIRVIRVQRIFSALDAIEASMQQGKADPSLRSG
jgi:hypothetical protein